jgi:hypothetical protein
MIRTGDGSCSRVPAAGGPHAGVLALLSQRIAAGRADTSSQRDPDFIRRMPGQRSPLTKTGATRERSVGSPGLLVLKFTGAIVAFDAARVRSRHHLLLRADRPAPGPPRRIQKGRCPQADGDLWTYPDRKGDRHTGLAVPDRWRCQRDNRRTMRKEAFC